MMDPTGPKPPLVQSDLLREQHFGDVEGERCFLPPAYITGTPSLSSVPSEERGKRKSPLSDRKTCFPNGESSEDVARRVDAFISKFIIPHVLESSSSPPNDDNDVNTEQQQQQEPLNIVIVSHGIAISELIGALFRRGSQATRSACAPESWRGMVNTAWTRLTVSLLQVRFACCFFFVRAHTQTQIGTNLTNFLPVCFHFAVRIIPPNRVKSNQLNIIMKK